MPGLMSLLYEITAPVPFTRQPKVPSGTSALPISKLSVSVLDKTKVAFLEKY